MKKYIPNLCSLLNLTSGCVGVIMALQGNGIAAARCILVGLLADFFDGFLARMLHVQSALGKQLDSLADLITFGLLPGTILYGLLQQATATSYFPCIALLIPMSAALRLARFNITPPQQKHVFIGLPTPASAALIGTLPFIHTASSSFRWIAPLVTHPYLLTTIVVLCAGLMVARVRFMALKFTTFSWHANRVQYSFLLLVMLLSMAWKAAGMACSILLYLVLSCCFQHKLPKA